MTVEERLLLQQIEILKKIIEMKDQIIQHYKDIVNADNK